VNPSNSLAQLKDIHLPEAVSWWPLAIGWWFMGIFMAVFIYWAVQFGLRHYFNQHYRRQALSALNNLPDLDQYQRLIALFDLLKQVANSAYPEHNFASLNNREFIRFLQTSCSKPLFNDLPANWEQLFYAKHQSVTSDLVDPLITQSRYWIKHHPRIEKLGYRRC
jgi:hypothetical protein